MDKFDEYLNNKVEMESENLFYQNHLKIKLKKLLKA